MSSFHFTLCSLPLDSGARQNAMHSLQPNPISSGLPPHQVFRIHEVMGIVKVSRSTIYLWMSLGTFPKPLKLGARAVGWLASDIFEWLAEREVA